ncbi:MAG: DsrE family protein [Candidatus Heimdallarchaeota archaeon]
MSSFPLKYFFILVNSPEETLHRNSTNAGLRLALTLLMDEFEVHILLTEEAIFLAQKQDEKTEQQTIDQFSDENEDKEVDAEDASFSSYELLEGIISFGGKVLTCKSSLALTGLKEEDIIEGVKLVHLQTAVKIMVECSKILTF